ncbi:inosine-uridine preferring nucleoside hydrolase family protein [Thalictrum thalictroides]|uniref:Inosine-uridine preferring nucleoside hydrolase family protein n=1 Tax=Thalictrum thalictroides TaxID=46969 RepID=A0A7J6W6H0_THATH|nr:inosine-uridine preferring nucleoside hydrolase family protein [Thalictrum thalictroides]
MLKKIVILFFVLFGFIVTQLFDSANALPRRILLDTDVDTDDLFALLYLLKLNRSEIDLQAITINTNAWTSAGHAVNQVYDILYMMGRDDIQVGVGGEGGILPNGNILPNVGGYLPIIDQGISTVGGCRYIQAIPVGLGGVLDIDTNYGLRRGFLPQGGRKYSPLRQPTAQQVMIETISKGPTTVFVIGAHTNFAIFLMSNPHLKKNIEHIYVMGGGVRSKNPTGCCPKGDSSCKPRQCNDHGNLFTGYTSNPYAEFNIFGDPFAAYQVFHSGIPLTLVPLDATNTIPITKEFFMLFEKRQDTYEAQYVFQSLKMARDTWFDDQFYTSYFMWDSFTSGVASSIMRNLHKPNGENEFAEMEYMNITIVTSNEPYGISDGSNPFFDGRATPKFNLQKSGVHSGHVQMGLNDPLCLVENGKGRCQDGFTKEVTGTEGVRVLVATKAKPNQDVHSELDREFFKNFLDVMNYPHQSGRFNFSTEFPYYKEIIYKPDFGKRKLGKPVVFDMDMSAGDFLSLIYLLKVPVEEINLKGILVSATGWTNAASIDIIYDILHMMGRDDIPVGRGEVFAMGQTNPSFTAVGDCKYHKAIPHGSGGLLDSDTLYGFARNLPRSPRRYTAENSVKFGAPRDTDRPELRQPLAMEVWQSITKSMHKGSKISILTSGPLSNLGQIILSEKNVSSVIETVYVVGGHITSDDKDKGNVFTLPSNKYAELNMFLDPYAAKTVLESGLDITLIPLGIQHNISSFPEMIETLRAKRKTPEAVFARQLLSGLYSLHKKHHRYHHMDIFLGEILGAVILSGDHHVQLRSQVKPVSVLATGDISKDGQIFIDEKNGSYVKIMESVNPMAYYQHFADRLSNKMQSAVIGSFSEQKKIWSTPPT